MSVFDTPNAEQYHGQADEASDGPRLGFQDAIVAAWDAQTKVHALYAIETAFGDAERAQIDKMRTAGLRPHEPLASDFSTNTNDDGYDMGLTDRSGRIVNPYMDAARSIAGTGQADVDGAGGGQMADAIRMRDNHILQARAEHPELDLKTYAEMFAGIQQQAQAAVKRDDLSKTVGGHIGALLGGTAASMNPVTDPLNVISAPVGGFGKSIAMRVAGQAGIQGGLEGANEVVNPDTNRLLLGQDLTPGERAMRIGGAAVGGALVQGFGEAAVAGVRRVTTGKWFHDAPAPEVFGPPDLIGPRQPMGENPARIAADRPITDFPDWEAFRETHAAELNTERVYGMSRPAQAREAEDVFYVAQQLDRWDGPNPAEIPARTAAARIPDVEPGVRYDQPYTRYIDRMETVDDVARRLDPDLFRQYDGLAADRDALRNTIEAERQRFADFKGADTFFEGAETARRSSEIEQRGKLQEIDYKMRDLAAAVSRAYGAAQQEWRTSPVDFATLNFLKDLENRTGWRYRGEDKPSLTEKPLRAALSPVPKIATVNETIPLARLSQELADRVGATGDAVDRVHANVEAGTTAVDDKVAHFVKQAREHATIEAADLKAQLVAIDKKLVVPELEAEARAKLQQERVDLEHVTLPDGSMLHLDNDHLTIETGDGVKSVSVREFLREMDKDQHALQSVVTCSRPS